MDVSKTVIVDDDFVNETLYTQNLENLENGTRTQDSYDLLALKGTGSQGSIYRSRVKSTGQIIALKVIVIKDEQVRRFADKELTALETIAQYPNCHPFLSCYFGHSYDVARNEMLIEMEYIEGVDLDKWSKYFRDKQNFDALDYNLTLLIIDLCEALQYIHSKNIIHRDIKPANILITLNNTPKLIDFGIACETHICNNEKNCCFGNASTPIFAAPETLRTNQSYFASDVWCLGTTIFNAATGSFCFQIDDPNNISEVVKIVVNTFPEVLATPNFKLNTSVNAMLVKDPIERPTVIEIKNFLKNN